MRAHAVPERDDLDHLLSDVERSDQATEAFVEAQRSAGRYVLPPYSRRPSLSTVALPPSGIALVRTTHRMRTRPIYMLCAPSQRLTRRRQSGWS
jgi:hypothetical protein